MQLNMPDGANPMGKSPNSSIVIPCHNERGNLTQLASEIHDALEPIGAVYEIIFVDDASTDGTWEVLAKMGANDGRIRALRFARRCGQSAAMWAGIQQAQHGVIVTLDADLQNPPAEIPRLLAALEDVDCVCGTRVASRKSGDAWLRRMASQIANSVRTRLTKDGINDSGCCYRAFRRECVRQLWFFDGAHRFLPALLKLEGCRVVELSISHRPRGYGETHYGIWRRLLRTLPDLLAVRWMRSRFIRYQITDIINPPKKE